MYKKYLEMMPRFVNTADCSMAQLPPSCESYLVLQHQKHIFTRLATQDYFGSQEHEVLCAASTCGGKLAQDT